MPSLSEIGDLSIITSYLVLPGFLVDTLLKHIALHDHISVNLCDHPVYTAYF